MSLIDDAKDRVFDRLMAEPFFGTHEDLAVEVGINRVMLRKVLEVVRSPEHVAEHSWTIPYGVRGSAANTWRIIDADEMRNDEVMQAANDRRAAEMLSTTRRNIGQAQLALASLDGRSRAAREWRDVLQSQTEIEYRLMKMVAGEDDD